MANYKAIDLFCGCGGMSWGFKCAGFQVLLGADINPKALKTFAINFPEASILETDLSTYSPQKLLCDLQLQPGELDCLMGNRLAKDFPKTFPVAIAKSWITAISSF